MIKNKEYWREKKREQRAKIKAAKDRVAVEVEVEKPKAEVKVGRPTGATDAEWKVSQDRAEKAKKHAVTMGVRRNEERFQRADWQWWNEYRKEDRIEFWPKLEPVVLVKRGCEKCDGVWSSSVEMECPYCHGKGRKAA